MATFDPSEQVSFLADDAGMVVTWNPRCAALFGLAAPEALGRDAAGLLPWPRPPDRRRVLPALPRPRQVH